MPASAVTGSPGLLPGPTYCGVVAGRLGTTARHEQAGCPMASRGVLAWTHCSVGFEMDGGFEVVA